MVRITHNPIINPAAPAAPTTLRRRATALAKRDRPLAAPFRILCDTREQSPWPFMSLRGWSDLDYRPLQIETREETLPTGDYTAESIDKKFRVPCLIERKSADDLIGSLGAGHQRFDAEHVRMTALVERGWYCCVIIESSLAEICDRLDDPLFGRRLTAAGVIGAATLWPVKFGVHWLFAGDRRRAEMCALRLLWSRYQEAERVWRKSEIARLTAAPVAAE